MKLISIASGKGGVGKTTLTCNLAVAMAEQNKKILIIDGDLGMANVDIFFGVRPKHTVEDLLSGVPISECVTQALKNVDILAGGSGLYNLTQMNAFQRREMMNQVSELKFKYDYALIDTAPGLHDYVLHLNSVADQCLIVITQDPSSFADAYALIKVLHQKYKTQNFKVVCNLIDESNGDSLFVRFSEVVEKFLPVRLSYLGSLPQDQQLKKIQQMQRSVFRQDSIVPSAKVFRQFASHLVSEQNAISFSGTLSKGLEGIFNPVAGHA
jgi:flagellar biosynthesis protein FlhG